MINPENNRIAVVWDIEEYILTYRWGKVKQIALCSLCRSVLVKKDSVISIVPKITLFNNDYCEYCMGSSMQETCNRLKLSEKDFIVELQNAKTNKIKIGNIYLVITQWDKVRKRFNFS